MAEETRKDPRAKVLSMTVRYKSANVDEFIENHSHDVSRGGIFIKTASPFPPGTLLKFEIRIQDEKPVLSGVGRVVWKRDSDQTSDESPAGMGVKFIKIDDSTKSMIQRLVDKQGDGPNAYDAGKPADAAGDDADAPVASSSATPAPAKAAPRGATMLGLGTVGAAAKAGGKPAAAEEKKSESSGGGMFFPTTDPNAEMPPPEERTVMRQAAELLKQALEGTGSSLDEVGGKIELAKEEPKVEDKPVVAPILEVKKAEEPKAEEKAKEPKAEEKAEASEAEEKAEAPKAEEKKAAKTQDDGEKAEEKKPVAAVKSDAKKPAAAAVAKTKDGEAKPAATKPKVAMAKATMSAPEPAEESSGSGRILTILLIAAAVVGALFLALGDGNKPAEPAKSVPSAEVKPSGALPKPPVTAEAMPSAAPAASSSAAPESSAAPPASASAAAAPTVPAPSDKPADTGAKPADTGATGAKDPPAPAPAPAPAKPKPADPYE